jgi:hypothetical protein
MAAQAGIVHEVPPKVTTSDQVINPDKSGLYR